MYALLSRRVLLWVVALLGLSSLTSFAQSTTVKFTAPGGFSARYVIVQFTYPDWSPFGAEITSGFGTTVYLTNGQSYSVTKDMRYTGANVSVVASWREDSPGSTPNASGSGTPTPGGTLEFYTGAAPPEEFWIKKSISNGTLCESYIEFWKRNAGGTDEFLQAFTQPAGETSVAVIGPFPAPFPYYYTVENGCLNGGFATSTPSTNSWVSSTNTGVSTTVQGPVFTQFQPGTSDTTNITFSTGGTNGARDDTLKEGFSALRSVIEQGNRQTHNDLVGIGQKLDSINITANGISETLVRISNLESNSLATLRGITNMLGQANSTNFAAAASDADASIAEQAGVQMAAQGTAITNEANAAFDPLQSAAEGKATEAAGGEVVGDPNVWKINIAGAVVDLNPRQVLGVIPAWIYNIILLGLTYYYLSKSYDIAWQTIYRATAGSMNPQPQAVESYGSPLTAPVTTVRIVARFVSSASGKVAVVTILLGLPGLVMAFIEARYGTASSLSANPFYTGLSSPYMREGVAILAEWVPLRTALAYAFGLLMVKLFAMKTYYVTSLVARNILFWTARV